MGAVDMVWRFTYQGFEDLGKFVSHTIGYWPQLDTIGLSGVSSLWILGSPENLGGTPPVWYIDL